MARRFYFARILEVSIRMLADWKHDYIREEDGRSKKYALSQRRCTPEEYSQNLSLLVENIKHRGSGVIVLGIATPEKQYREAVRMVAARETVPFVPVWQLFRRMAPVVRNADIYRSDRQEMAKWFTPQAYSRSSVYGPYLTIDPVHPTKIGHRIIAGELYDVFAKTFKTSVPAIRD